jgi:hypothetical protein
MDYIGFISFLLSGIKARVLMKLEEKHQKTWRFNNAEYHTQQSAGKKH